MNCEIELGLSLSKECIRCERLITIALPGNPDAITSVLVAAIIQITGATFQIYNGKLYVPAVTLPINDNINILENTKQGFKGKFFGTNINLK